MQVVLEVLLFVGLIVFSMYCLFSDEIKEFLKNKKGKERIMKLKDLQKGNVFYTKKGNYFVVGKADGDKTATNLKTGKTGDLYDSFEDDDLVKVWDKLSCIIDTDPIWERKDTLDDSEKAYLGAVIKPFKDRVDYIKKIESPSGKYHSILIAVDSVQNNSSQAYINLPLFKAGTMYENMDLGVKYSLADLGL